MASSKDKELGLFSCLANNYVVMNGLQATLASILRAVRLRSPLTQNARHPDLSHGSLPL